MPRKNWCELFSVESTSFSELLGRQVRWEPEDSYTTFAGLARRGRPLEHGKGFDGEGRSVFVKSEIASEIELRDLGISKYLRKIMSGEFGVVEWSALRR